MSFTESLFGVAVELEIIAMIWKCDLSECNGFPKLVKWSCVTCLPMVGMASFGYWWIQLAHRLHLVVKLLINDIHYNDQNKKIHFALQHYVHACQDELRKKSIRSRSESTNSHPIKYNFRL